MVIRKGEVLVYLRNFMVFFIFSVFTATLMICSSVEANPDPRNVESGFCSTSPDIDGRIELEEWLEAKTVTFGMDYYNVDLDLAESHPVKIHIMNNNDDLFVGLTLKQEEYNGKWNEGLNQASIDVFIILFDENNNGVFDNGEDKKFLSLIDGYSIYGDQHMISEEEEIRGEQEEDKHQDGVGKIRHSNIKGVGDYTAEFKIPLSSGDAYDIDLKPGTRIRWNLLAFDKFGGDIKKLSFGALSEPDTEDSSGWGYLDLAAGPSEKKVSLPENLSVTEALSAWSSKRDKADTKVESKNGWVRLWYQVQDFWAWATFHYKLPFKLEGKGLVVRAMGEGAWMVSLGLSDSLHSGLEELIDIPYFMIEAKDEPQDLYLPFSDFGFRSDHTGDVSMPNPGEIKSLFFTPSLGWAEKGQSDYLEIKEIKTYESGSPSNTDEDGDGIPNGNDWDIDGDGWFNVFEGYAGTDPMDPSKFPDGKLTVPSEGCYTGSIIFSGATGMLDYETLTGMKPAIIVVHPGWEINQNARLKMERPLLDWIWRHGSIPKYSWYPEDPVRLQDILDGKHDQMLEELAEEIKALKQPIVWTYGTEVDGSPMESSNALWNFGKDGTKKWFEVDDIYTYYGDPKQPDGIERWKDYVAYIRRVFDGHGVNNLVYLFHLLGAEYTVSGDDVLDGMFPVPGDWNSVNNYYPGDNLVDWCGFSKHECGWLNGSRYMTISDSLMEDYWTKLRTVCAGKPIMIVEFSILPQAYSNPEKSRTLVYSDVFKEMKTRYPSIKAWLLTNTRYMSPPIMDLFPFPPYMDQNSPSDEIEAFKAEVTLDTYFIKNPILSPKSEGTVVKSPVNLRTKDINE